VNYYQAIHSHVAAKLALRRAMGTIIGGTPQAEPTGENSAKVPAEAGPPAKPMDTPPPAEVGSDENR